MQRYKENSKVNEIYAKIHFFEDKTSILPHFSKIKSQVSYTFSRIKPITTKIRILR